MSTSSSDEPRAPAAPSTPEVDIDADHGRDSETAREGLELELMDQDASEVGEHIGEHNP